MGSAPPFDEFVEEGGGLLATFASSLFDETARQRPDFGLADVFGVSYAGRVEGPMQNSYLSLDAEGGRRHEVLAGFGDTERIINGVYRLEVRPSGEFPSPLTLIPTYPDLPMEDVYPRVPHTTTRELYLRDSGRGRVVYLPWDIDRTFWDVMCVDHLRLLQNSIRWAANETPPVVVEGPGLIDVTIWRQRSSLTVHLVNLTNPMMMKGPLRETIPVGPQRVSIRLPAGSVARNVQLLTAGSRPQVGHTSDRLTLTVPAIEVHEVIAIDL